MGVEVVDSIAPREIEVGAVSQVNGTANLSLTNVAPAAVTTATISKWLKVVDKGNTYFIPMWT